MDIATTFPPVQRGKTISNDCVKGFAMSLQGASHLRVDPPVPCQDYSDIRYLEEEKLLIAAIADGVGSCKLSHWGAYTAVKTVLDSVELRLRGLSNGNQIVLDAKNDALKSALKTIMVEGFDNALSAVENCADNANPPQTVFSLQSTLTLAIYDGRTLFHGHVGDDGIVVQSEDGQVVLATKRLKGEEASSVYPLQSGKSHWAFGLSVGVTAFVMATDGVLDAFVMNHNDYFAVNYNNGIFYSFMEDAVYKMAENTPDAAKRALKQYYDYLMSDGYRSKVTDDLTMVCVVSTNGIQIGKHPEFNIQIWRTIEEESNKARRNRLASRPVQPAPTAPSTINMNQPSRSMEADLNATQTSASGTGARKQIDLGSNRTQTAAGSAGKASNVGNTGTRRPQNPSQKGKVSSAGKRPASPPNRNAKNAKKRAKKKALMIAIIAGTAVGCLAIGICVGRFLFPKKGSAENVVTTAERPVENPKGTMEVELPNNDPTETVSASSETSQPSSSQVAMPTAGSSSETTQTTEPTETTPATAAPDGKSATTPTEGDPAAAAPDGKSATTPTEGDPATAAPDGKSTTTPTEGDQSTSSSSGAADTTANVNEGDDALPTIDKSQYITPADLLHIQHQE